MTIVTPPARQGWYDYSQVPHVAANPLEAGVPKDRKYKATISKLAGLLQRERLRQGLSLSETATRAGLSHAMVARVEKGERVPTIETLLRIADALDCNLVALLDEALIPHNLVKEEG